MGISIKKILLITLSCQFLLAGSVFALPLPNVPANPIDGVYIGNFSGNDPSNPSADLTTLESSIETWWWTSFTEVIDLDLVFYAKVDEPSTTTTEGSGTLTIGYDSEKKSGTWETTGTDLIQFYSVKAGPNWSLYYVGQLTGANNGEWDTSYLDNKEISHFSSWQITTSDTPPPAPVPEPTTMLLFGTGIAGLAAVGRRRK